MPHIPRSSLVRAGLHLALALLVFPPILPGLTWSQNPPAPVPVAKGYHAAGVVADRIYVAGGGCLGGFSCIESTASAFAYDPAADSWRELDPLQHARTYPAGAVAPLETPPGSGTFEDRFYVLGGTDIRAWPDQVPETSIEEYDPTTGTWRLRGATVPPAIALSSRAVTVDGRLYLIGGHDAGSFTLSDQVWVYDPNMDTLSPFGGDPLPQPRSEGAAVAVGRTIYYFGGWRGTYGEPTTTALALDLDSGAWTSLEPMPRASAANAALVVGGTIYVLGGWNGTDRAFPFVDAYDIASDIWTADSQLGCIAGDLGLEAGRSGLTAHLASDGTNMRAYAVGGNAGGGTQLSCNESALTTVTQDVTPPEFAGLLLAEEPECPDPPRVLLSWSDATELESPPVTYSIYRGRSPGFLPAAGNRVAQGVSGQTYTDADVLCWSVDPRPYYYIVHAVDSAVPPNEDDNTSRVPIPVLCETPPPPPDVGTRLFVSKDPGQVPLLDWSSYPAAGAVAGYTVYRRLDDPRNLYDYPYSSTVDPELVEPAPEGRLLLYKVRSVIDCLDVESED